MKYQTGAAQGVLISDGDLLSHDGTAYTKIGVGTDGYSLTSRPGAAQGLKLGWELRLANVIEDTTPQLGGALQTTGNPITITRSDDSFHGAIAPLTTDPGVAFGYYDGSDFDPANGGLTLEPGQVQLYGTVTTVNGLAHSDPARQVVYVNPDGSLYRVDEPPQGWTESATSTTTASLGTGTGTGSWTNTGLTLAVGGDLSAGDRIDVSTNIRYENRTDDKPGNVSMRGRTGVRNLLKSIKKFTSSWRK